MDRIRLDPRKLLGFKILTTDELKATLLSPKIGVKTLIKGT